MSRRKDETHAPGRSDGSAPDAAGGERPSKSARKREAQTLQELGARLAALSDAQREQLDLSESLAKALADYRAVGSHGAKRRQLQFIGRVMRDEDVAILEEALAGLEQRSAATRFRHHELERWRARLIESDAALTEYVSERPTTDLPRLRILIRAARGRPEIDATVTAHRELFRYLRANAS